MTFLWKNNAENHPTNSRYQELTLFMKKVMQLDVRCTGLVSFSWIKIKTLKETTQKLFYFQLILRNPPSLFSRLKQKSISHCFPFPFKVYLMHYSMHNNNRYEKNYLPSILLSCTKKFIMYVLVYWFPWLADFISFHSI